MSPIAEEILRNAKALGLKNYLCRKLHWRDD